MEGSGSASEFITNGEREMVMRDSAVNFDLDADIAIVLFEMLSRWSSGDQPLEVADRVEDYALLQVVAQLEKQLIAPFQPNYKAIVSTAREAVRRRAT